MGWTRTSEMCVLALALYWTGCTAWQQPMGVSARRRVINNADPNQFGQGPSLQWGGTDTTTSGARKLTEALEEADVERKKAIEEVRVSYLS